MRAAIRSWSMHSGRLEGLDEAPLCPCQFSQVRPRSGIYLSTAPSGDVIQRRGSIRQIA
jgi:hypothetical protein